MENSQETKDMQTVPTKKLGKLDSFFGITKAGSTIRTEIVAGIVTFLAMCYILTVNPNQFFWGGKMGATGPTFTATDHPYWASVFIATAFGAIVGTLLMAFLAKLPLAQAPGMGLNSLVGSIIGGGLGGTFVSYKFDFSLGNAMAMVLISGVLFFMLSAISIKGVSLRQKIFEGIPTAIKTAIPVGIGLFIAYIGMQNAGIIVSNDYTQVGVIDFTNWAKQIVNHGAPAAGGAPGGTYFSPITTTPATAVVALSGLIAIAVLAHLKVKGAVIFGILIATLIGIPLGVTNLNIVLGNEPGITWKFWENFGTYFSENGVFAKCFTEGFNFPAGSLFTVIMLVITMSMIDMFDTMGTCVGCCSAAGLMDENGTPINYNKIMYADSVATCAGAVFGTSTVTTFVESGAGIATGGRTGLTALTTAIMFALAIFALPLFAMIPSAASASALLYVGVLMMKGIKNIDFSDIRTAVPAFLAIAIMPLGYSITKGIGVAILSFVVISALAYAVGWIKYAITKEEKPVWNVSIVTIVIAVLFSVYFFVPVVI